MGLPASRRFSSPRARVPFVGRGPERTLLSDALVAAADGRGALYLIAGEAGIGKTRLAETVAGEATERGDTVLWGSAWQAGGAPAYWPWTQVVRGLVQERPAAEIREDLGAGGPLIAPIAPEVGEHLGAAAPATTLDSEAARFAAFDAVASFLRAAADRRPLLVVLDDLHAADVASLRLLELVARGLYTTRILVLGTHRPEGGPELHEDVAAALADLRQPGERLRLDGLAVDEVAEVAAARTQGPPPAGLAERLHALTEGNPLFVDEVMRLLAVEGSFDPEGRLPLPEGVRETIRRRVDPLGPALGGLLGEAAVIGPEFRVETLALVSGVQRAALLEQLDVAEAADLVEPDPRALGRYRFSHALVRETLYDELGARERARLHAAVGEALVALHGDGPGAPVSELAHHFLQAAPAGDPGRAATYAQRAGERAMEALAYEQAIEFFADALRALELQPLDAGRRAAILLALGSAEMRAARLEAGRRTLMRSVEFARDAGDPETLANAALAWSPWGLATGVGDEESLVPLLQEARDRLPPADGALRARVLARLATVQYWSAPPARRLELAEEAIAMARRVGDGATLALVLSDAHRATWDPDSPDRALPWASEIYALAEREGNMELALTAHSWRISLLLELGELAVVDREIETFAQTAQRLRQPRAQVAVHVHACARALIDGRYEDAEAELGQAAQFAGLLQEDQFLGMRIAALAFVMRYAQGRLGELEAAVRQFADAQPAMPVWRCGLLSVYVQTERDDDLRRAYDALLADGLDALPRDNLWLPAVALIAEAAAHLGDASGAREVRERLTPYAGRNVVTPDVAYFGPVDRYLALAAATAGERDEAAALFASARDLAERMGARPVLDQLARDEERVLGAAAPATPAAPPAPTPTAAHLRRQGDVWEIAWSGASFHVKDAKGVHYLGRLLASPGIEQHALDLAGASAASARTSAGAVDPELSIRGRGQDDAGAMLDARAKAEYRQRIEDLREEIEEADAFNDVERAGRAREELEFLGRELSAAVGLGGRDRRAASASERARVNVTRSLRATVERIAKHDAGLGHHLRTCVRTGTFCVYEPGPDAAAWEVDPLD